LIVEITDVKLKGYFYLQENELECEEMGCILEQIPTSRKNNFNCYYYLGNSDDEKQKDKEISRVVLTRKSMDYSFRNKIIFISIFTLLCGPCCFLFGLMLLAIGIFDVRIGSYFGNKIRCDIPQPSQNNSFEFVTIDFGKPSTKNQ